MISLGTQSDKKRRTLPRSLFALGLAKNAYKKLPGGYSLGCMLVYFDVLNKQEKRVL
jgi:hypothetical protein